MNGTTFLVIALRNIGRNGRRSLITIFSIAFGLGAIIFLWGYIDGAHLQLKENFTGLFTGHLQIHAAGFEKTGALTRVIDNPAPLEALLGRQHGISAFCLRVRTDAFFRTPANSTGGLLVGIDPVKEPQVSKIGSTLRTGRFLRPGDTKAVVLGQSMAESLKAALGDEVVIMAQGSGGSVVGMTLRVAGIMKTGVPEIDKGMALAALGDVQGLLGLEKGVTDVVVRTRSLSRLDETAKALRKDLAGKGLEMVTWAQISPILQQWIDFDEAFAYVFLLIVLIVIVAGILNTILMAMLERTREFGVMLALGTRDYQLAFMVGAESFFLGLMGLAAGIALGLASVLLFARIGVPVSGSVKEALAAFFISDVVYPVVEWSHLASNSLIVLATSMLISLYPAWRASRLKPAEAMRVG